MKIFLRPIEDIAFKASKDGGQIYFPNGVLGKGYVVDSQKTYKKLLSHHKRWAYLAIIIPALVTTKSFFAIVIGLIAFAFAHYLATKKVVAGLDVSSERLTLKEVREKNRNIPIFSKFTLIFLVVVGVVLFLFGCLLGLAAPEKFVFWLSFMVFGVAFIYLSLKQMRNVT